MQKTITLRFSSRCKQCGQTIPAGTNAYWLGSKQGVKHLSCQPPQGSESETKIEKPKEIKDGERQTFDYADLRTAFTQWVSSRDGWKSVLSNLNKYEGQHLFQTWDAMGSWVGCTIPEMQDWISNGYHVAGLDGISALVPTRPRRKLKYGEEGDELLIDLVHAGDDNPFVEWEKRNRKPGLSVEIHTVVNSHYPAETMTQYQRWIARALQTLDDSGVDMEVNIVMRNDSLYNGEYHGKMRETVIRVRKPGEAIDFANWSAMFSPGGYRMLGFTAWTLHAERNGHMVDTSLGHAVDYGKWTVDYDEDKNVVVIGNSQRVTSFPEMEMTEKLSAVLNKLTGA